MYRHLSNNYDAPYEQAHVGERPFDPGVVNCNNYDANGLLRACALPQSYPIFAYREAGASLLCSYWDPGIYDDITKGCETQVQSSKRLWLFEGLFCDRM